MSAQSDRQKPHFNTRVANQLSAQLRDGTAPMQRQGVQNIPYNPTTGRTFHGINAMNLMMQGRKDDRWFTFDEASLGGFKVKAGEKATPVQYWPPKQPGDTMNKAIIAHVFNAEQLDRVPPMPRKPDRPDPLERVTELLKNSGMTIVHDQAQSSFYAPRKDEIHLPKPENCASKEAYCEKALYEYFKASGHPDRLDRETFNAVGAADRAKEELVCTVATMMMCAEIGISHDSTRNPELALDWGNAMERHPFDLAKAMRDSDKAVWKTLQQEQALDASISFRSTEAWRPTPEASPAIAVSTFLDRNATLEMAKDRPNKVHTFAYQDRDVFAMPDKGTVLSKHSNAERPDETTMNIRTEAFDREGNTYNVTMQLTTVRNEHGLAEPVALAQAIDIKSAEKRMSLPMDWNGSLEVRGCADDMDGNIRSDITDPEQIQFYGVYANTLSGEQMHVVDFDTEEHAKRYVALVDKELDRQTGRDSSQEQTPEQSRDSERTASEQSQKSPKEPEITPRDECIAAMKSVGIIISGDHPIFDKKPHRIEAEGDKKNELSGFYVAHPDGRPSGYCKNNRTGKEKRWSVKGYILDYNQKKALHEQAKENVAKRDNESKAMHDKTAKRLQGQVKRYDVPKEKTPYMEKKDIQLHAGVYQNGSSTCVPLYNNNGEIRSMAYVQEDGTKRYAKNSEKEGSYHVVGGQETLKSAPALVVAEGYATAATIHESVGIPVVAAMDAGNVVDVAKALREAHPDKPIIIAADNDMKLEADKGINPGKNYAKQAAEAVNGVAIFPAFSPTDGQSKQLTDFNDLFRQQGKGEIGKEAVIGQIQPVIDKEIAKKEQSREQEPKVKKLRGQKELARA